MLKLAVELARDFPHVGVDMAAGLRLSAELLVVVEFEGVLSLAGFVNAEVASIAELDVDEMPPSRDAQFRILRLVDGVYVNDIYIAPPASVSFSVRLSQKLWPDKRGRSSRRHRVFALHLSS